MKFRIIYTLVILVFSAALIYGQTNKPAPSNLPKDKIYELTSAEIQIKVPENLTVDESIDSLQISNSEGDWELEILDVGNGKNAGEITVKNYLGKMRTFKILGRSYGKFPNGMIFTVNRGTGVLDGKQIKWYAHLIEVSKNQYIHSWCIFRNNAENNQTKKLIYANILAGIEKF
jgi:hypothetical protein